MSRMWRIIGDEAVKPPIRWGRVLCATAATLLVAVVASATAMLIFMGDWETVPLGLSVPIFIAPALVGYVLCSALWRNAIARHLAFWIPFLAAVGAFLPVALGTLEGSDMAMAILVPTAAAGLLGYAFAQVSPICKPRNLRQHDPRRCPQCEYPIGISNRCTECGAKLQHR